MSYASAVLADSPAVYMRCKESSGLLQDSSGNGRNATVADGVALYQQTSPITSDGSDFAIRCQGDVTGGAFEVPDSAGVDLGDVMTCECWVKRADTGRDQSMISKGLEAYGLSFHSDDNIYWSKDGDLDLVVSTITITDTTTFHHVVATKDGTGTGSVKLYIDAVDRTSVLFDDQVMINTNSNLFLGQSAFGGGVMDAYMDEYAVYPTALSAARVLAHYNAAFAASGPGDNPPIGILGRGAGW